MFFSRFRRRLGLEKLEQKLCLATIVGEQLQFIPVGDIAGMVDVEKFVVRSSVKTDDGTLYLAGGFDGSGQASVIHWNHDDGSALLTLQPAVNNESAVISSAALTESGAVIFFGTSYVDSSTDDRLTIWNESGTSSTIEPFGNANLTNGGFIAPNGLLASGENGGDQGVYDLENGNTFTLIPNTGSNRVGAINNEGVVTLKADIRRPEDYSVSYVGATPGEFDIPEHLGVSDNYVAGSYLSLNTFATHGALWDLNSDGTTLDLLHVFGPNTAIGNYGLAEDNGVAFVNVEDVSLGTTTLYAWSQEDGLFEPEFPALDGYTFDSPFRIDSGSVEAFGVAIRNSDGAEGILYFRAEVMPDAEEPEEPLVTVLEGTEASDFITVTVTEHGIVVTDIRNRTRSEPITEGQIFINTFGGNDIVRLHGTKASSSSSMEIVVNTGDGNDLLMAFRFPHSLFAFTGDGNDTVYVQQSEGPNVNVDVGEGNDRVRILASNGQSASVDLGEGNNVAFVKSNLSEVTVLAEDGNNVIHTGSGNDMVKVGNGNNVIITGAGNDFVRTGNGRNVVMLGRGDDAFLGGNGRNVAYGGGGDDILSGGSGSNTFFGQDGDDVFVDNGGKNRFYGGNGVDAYFLGLGQTRIIDRSTQSYLYLEDEVDYRWFGRRGDMLAPSLSLRDEVFARLGETQTL